MGRVMNYPSTPATSAYNHLRSVDPYHPLTVETFGDWAVEAGDKVSVSRGNQTFVSPVHEAKLVWKGQPEVELISTGNEERVAIGKMEKRKYAGGGSGLRDSWSLYHFEVNQAHLLYDVYNDYYGRLHAAVEMTSSKLGVLMEDWYNGLFGYLEMTASHLLAQFWGLYDGLSSELELTRSALTVKFQGMYDGLSSQMELTRSKWELQFRDAYNGLSSEIEMTASRLRIAFHGLYDGLESRLEMTRSALTIQFWGLYDGLSSELELTRSALTVQFHGLYDGLNSKLEMTRSALTVQFYGLYDGLSSELKLTRSALTVQFTGLYDGLHSELLMTRSALTVEFTGLYDGLNARIEVTRDHLRTEFSGLYDGLKSELTITRSTLYTHFEGLYDGLRSDLIITRSALYTQFTGLYDGLHSELLVTRSTMYVHFQGLYDGLDGKLTMTRSVLTAHFENLYQGLDSRLTLTASTLRTTISNNYSGLVSYIEQTASSITLSADHIYLDGSTTLAGWLTLDQGSLKVNGSSVITGNLTMGSNTTIFGSDVRVGSSLYFSGSTPASSYTLNNSTVGGMIKSSAVSGSVLTFTHVNGDTTTVTKSNDGTTLTFKDQSGGTLTFEKAASKVSGSWSSNVLTVSADSSGQNLPYSETINTTFANSQDGYYIGATRLVGSNPSTISGTLKYYQIGLSTAGTSADPHTRTTYAQIQTTSGTQISSTPSKILTTYWDAAWGAARAMCALPDVGTSSSMVVKIPSATVGNQDSTTYYLDSDSTYVYLKTDVSGSAYTVARATNSGGGGVTKVKGTWSTNTYTVSADNTGTSTSVSETFGSTFGSSQSGYYIAATHVVGQNTPTISGTLQYFQLGLNSAGTKVQIQNTSGTKYSGTPEYTIPSSSVSVSSATIGSWYDSKTWLITCNLSDGGTSSVGLDCTIPYNTGANAAGNNLHLNGWSSTYSGGTNQKYTIISGTGSSANIGISFYVNSSVGSGQSEIVIANEGLSKIYRDGYSEGSSLHSNTVTMKQQLGYASTKKIVLYYKDNNGTYHEAASGAQMYWYYSSKDLNTASSYKTLYY